VDQWMGRLECTKGVLSADEDPYYFKEDVEFKIK
jgi:hypothetical protein